MQDNLPDGHNSPVQVEIRIVPGAETVQQAFGYIEDSEEQEGEQKGHQDRNQQFDEQVLELATAQQLIKTNLRTLNLATEGIGYKDGDENKDGGRGQPGCHDVAYAKGSFACAIK
ncbi:hypothetical protein ANG2_0193 [Streptococcus constellatus subsp. constellatus SK53]|nr:hypothetical protein ANG2_0193 [Streptococcus constellatus subsp. constellatus SK53]